MGHRYCIYIHRIAANYVWVERGEVAAEFWTPGKTF
jgi:hypothetical protein